MEMTLRCACVHTCRLCGRHSTEDAIGDINRILFWDSHGIYDVCPCCWNDAAEPWSRVWQAKVRDFIEKTKGWACRYDSRGRLVSARQLSAPPRSVRCS